MKKILVILTALVLCITCADAQKKGSQSHVIGFYNLENLWADAQLTEIPNLD